MMRMYKRAYPLAAICPSISESDRVCEVRCCQVGASLTATGTNIEFDETTLVRLPFVSPGAHPVGVNNAFIAAKPGHPFLARLLEAVPRHDLKWRLPIRIPYVENMLSTGCMFFTNQWMKYVRSLSTSGETQSVFILADESGSMAPHMLRGKATTPIFVHGGESSWHSWDAAMFLTISNHYLLCIAGAILAIGVGLSCFYMCSAYRRRSAFRKGFRVLGVISPRTSWSISRDKSIKGDTIA